MVLMLHQYFCFVSRYFKFLRSLSFKWFVLSAHDLDNYFWCLNCYNFHGRVIADLSVCVMDDG